MSGLYDHHLYEWYIVAFELLLEASSSGFVYLTI